MLDQQLHLFNPCQQVLDLELPKRGNPNFRNKYQSGKTKPVRIPVARIAEVQAYLESLENNPIQKTFHQEVEKLSVTQLRLAPKRFQYKLVHGSTGSTGSLRGVKEWDENLAGLILVWVDPEDGNIYVINGHNRLNLAISLGVEKVWVRFIDANNAIQARAIGALANIADDKGNAIDAAKFFRDMAYTSDNLPGHLDMGKSICRQGLALARLTEFLFLQVVNGEMPQGIGVAIGENLPDQSLQSDLWELLKTKRNLTIDLVCELCQIVTTAKQTVQESDSVTLFDLECFVQSNAVYLAEIQAYIRQRLSRDKRLFATVSKSRNANDLARGNNQIDTAKSSELAGEAEYVLRLFDDLKSYKNHLTELLNGYADQLMDGKNCKDECYKAVFDYLSKVTLRELAV